MKFTQLSQVEISRSLSLSDNQPGLAGGPLSQAPSQAQSSDSDSRHSVMEISGKERRPPPGNTSCKAASRCWSGKGEHGNRSERDGIALRDRLLGQYIKRVQAATQLPYFGATGTEFSNHRFDVRNKDWRTQVRTIPDSM